MLVRKFIEPDVDEVIESIVEKLYENDWGRKLRYFLRSPDMKCIVRALIQLKLEGKYFCPKLCDAFNWALQVPYEDIRVILFCSNQTDYMEYADGIPIHGPYGSLAKDILYSMGPESNVTKWPRQGVLQLPISMTRTVGGESNIEIWKPMITHIINKLNKDYEQVPYVMIGKPTIVYKNTIRSPYKTTVDIWPYNHNNSWEKVNRVLEQQGELPIDW